MYNTVQISGIRGMNAGVSSMPPFATECPQKPNLLPIRLKLAEKSMEKDLVENS